MKISKREKEVLHLIAYEYTAKEIAQKLYISTHTVDTHRKNLLDKMDARNTAGIIRRAFERGILQISTSNFSGISMMVLCIILNLSFISESNSQTFTSGHSDVEYSHILSPGLSIKNKTTSIFTSSNIAVYNNANYRFDYGVRSSTFGDGANHSFLQSWHNQPIDIYTGAEKRISIDSFGRFNLWGDALLLDTIMTIRTKHVGTKDLVGFYSVVQPDGADSPWGIGGVFEGGFRGIVAKSIKGVGVSGTSIDGVGLNGTSTQGTGTGGISISGIGTSGISNTSIGVMGISVDSSGVRGASSTYHGVVGESGSANMAGVYGYSIDVAGVGVHGVSNITVGVRGESPYGVGVFGASVDATGVVGSSTDGHGIDARSTNDHGIIASTQNAAKYDFKANGPGMDFGAGSSRRWKSNIQNIANPLELISNLRGVRYDWDQEHGAGRHDIGFIAEEVGAVLPEIVTYEENGVDAIAMDYTKVPALLVEAMNAMKEQYDAKLSAMEEELSLMSSQIIELKSTQNN